MKPPTKIKKDPSSMDFFCDQRTQEIPATNLFSADPSAILEFYEDLEQEAVDGEYPTLTELIQGQ